MKKRLKFRDDGTFVIVQFSDVEFLDEFDSSKFLFNNVRKTAYTNIIVGVIVGVLGLIVDGSNQRDVYLRNGSSRRVRLITDF